MKPLHIAILVGAALLLRRKITKALGDDGETQFRDVPVPAFAKDQQEGYAYWGPKEKNVWDQGGGGKAWKGGQSSPSAQEAPSQYSDIANQVNSWAAQWAGVPGVGANLAIAQAELAKLGVKI